MNILLLFATLLEAKPTIEHFKKTGLLVQKSPFHFKKNNLTIAISGIGPYSAYNCTIAHIIAHDIIIQGGLAGSFDLDLPIGSCREVQSVSFLPLFQNQNCPEALLFPKITLQNDGVELFTSPCPVYEQKRSSGLVDMEGYAIAQAGSAHSKPVHLLKIVSDHPSQNSSRLIRERMQDLSLQLSSNIIELVTAKGLRD